MVILAQTSNTLIRIRKFHLHYLDHAHLNGRPDLVIANKGSNDVSILLNQAQGNSFTFVPGPRLQAGTGPVSTVVQETTGDVFVHGRPGSGHLFSSVTIRIAA
jgi:hypothetical protein